VGAKFIAHENNITQIAFTWTFSQNFSELMKQNFDLNQDEKIDDKELRKIRLNLLDYLVPRHYLTDIEYYYKDENATKIEPNLNNYKLYFDEGRLKFDVSFKTNLVIADGLVVSVDVEDKEGYFNFKFTQNNAFLVGERFWAIPNSNANLIFFTFSSREAAKAHNEKPALKELLKEPATSAPDENLRQIDKIDEAKFDLVAKTSLSLLDRLKQILRSVDYKSPLALLFLAFISFGYGFLHAAGAGHGKVLTSSYFAATGGSYTRAFFFALKIGFMHVIGAFVFVFASFLLLREVSSDLTRDSASIMTAFSGIVIFLVAIFMLIKKVKFYLLNKKEAKFYIFSSNLRPKVSKNTKFTSDCGCQICSTKKPKSKEEWLVAAAAALVPCPGTILVFVLANEIGSYFAGVISGVFMALGMSAVIFLAAVFGAKINASTNIKLKRFKIYAEFAALSVMLWLGLFIFITTFTQKSLF
jgi:transporter, ni2+-co2+ transporter